MFQLGDARFSPHMRGMSGDTIAYVAFLVVLLVGLLLTALPRGNGARMARMAGTWVLIFVGVTVAAGLFQDIRSELPSQTYAGSVVSVPQGPGGHYYLTLQLDGTPVEFMVDTGATDIVLSHEDAERVGIDADRVFYTGLAQTANGVVRTGNVRIDEVRLGPIADHGVSVAVTEGEMPSSLLGMSYLDRFGSIRIENGNLTLTR